MHQTSFPLKLQERNNVASNYDTSKNLNVVKELIRKSANDIMLIMVEVVFDGKLFVP